ncbi:MAG: sigma 54-interacting transcriptional regulator, partial [Candidatus Cloacimonadaceae bacterium]|nr:sigma 54-interacting transcriptional regulator [Candidatus Cloacimonadota bacterium]
MSIDAYTALLHQLVLMSRDPLIYLAIDEENSGFNSEEQIAIRIAKAHALFSTLKLDAGLELAVENQKKLNQMDLPECSFLNLYILIGLHARLGNNQTMKTYTDEAAALITKKSPADIILLMDSLRLHMAFRTLHNTRELEQQLIDGLERIENPYCRVLILRSVAKVQSQNRQYDQALNYLIAAYDAANQNQLSTHSLDICIEIIYVCAHLSKFEMAERFFTLTQDLISQLRLPIHKVRLNYNYGILKNLQKDYRASVLFYKMSLEALESTGANLPITQYEIFNNLANTLNFLGESKQALDYQLEAEKTILETGTQDMKAELSSNIALSMIALQQWDEAIRRLKEVARFYKKHHKIEHLLGTTRSIAYFYEQRKDYVRGFAVLSQLDQLNQEYIAKLRDSHSQVTEQKLVEIMADSKALRAKYNNLLIEVTRRQAARFTGESQAAKRVTDSAVLAAMHKEANVLIQGESGTGKEVLAQMIHYSSPQKNSPFISVNCAAISPSLFEIEFFGSVAGPLTGISEERKGYFEQAVDGTLFLDEISEIPDEFQHKLLSALDAKSYTPVGKTQSLPIRCRIISSTNRDPIDLLKQNRLRMDLLHRLNTLEIMVPPLRNRMEDIPLLVESFARDFARETTKRLPQINDSFYDRLSTYAFPGNVRELKNIIERIFILFYVPVWTADILDNVDAFRRNQHLSGSLIDH